MKQVTEDTFVPTVLEGDLVLVDFYSTRCIPCKALAGILDKLEPEYPEVTFIKVDTDTVTEVADYYQVQTVPTLILFNKGDVQEMLVGLQPAHAIKTLLSEAIANA